MGGGEYNNLGHYMVRNQDNKTFKLDDVPKINSNRIIVDDMVDELNDFYKKVNKIKELSNKVVSVTVKISKSPFLKLLYCNNYRKMHGLPMRRKVRR